MTAIQLKIAPCPKCAWTVEFEPCSWLPKVVPLCPSCEVKQDQQWAKGEATRKWRKLYAARCPERYALARPDRVSERYRQILQWDQEAHGGGAGLVGVAGSGKSSAVACLMDQLRIPFLWISGTDARDLSNRAVSGDGEKSGDMAKWRYAHNADFLVLDDISQARFTEAWSSRLFGLLEDRLSHERPTIWTSQLALTDLKYKIYTQNGGDLEQAEAISRRLGQHSLKL
jgi:DNA replication protein DnaC